MELDPSEYRQYHYSILQVAKSFVLVVDSAFINNVTSTRSNYTGFQKYEHITEISFSVVNDWLL